MQSNGHGHGNGQACAALQVCIQIILLPCSERMCMLLVQDAAQVPSGQEEHQEACNSVCAA